MFANHPILSGGVCKSDQSQFWQCLQPFAEVGGGADGAAGMSEGAAGAQHLYDLTAEFIELCVDDRIDDFVQQRQAERDEAEQRRRKATTETAVKRTMSDELRVKLPSREDSRRANVELGRQIKQFARENGARDEVQRLEAMAQKHGVDFFGTGASAPGGGDPAKATVVDLWHYPPHSVKAHSFEISKSELSFSNPCFNYLYVTTPRSLAAIGAVTAEEQCAVLNKTIVVECIPFKMDSNAGHACAAGKAQSAAVDAALFSEAKALWKRVISAWLQRKFQLMGDKLLVVANGAPARVSQLRSVVWVVDFCSCATNEIR